MASLLSPIIKLLSYVIRCYQLIISPLIKPHCRFLPTCSQYSITAIHRFGIFKGIWLTLIRILRCNPWSQGGEDQVPLNIFDKREY
ncbi:membrane protein insertion efficiency factor YidD [Candidatus Palibaumannia cicadellinicola]|uniref:Putative membrane protein insertion efficiency factor n=1 Tax=Baumannia cicadellinicola subsp. Homalodisca coagulata TaxID=374463 RepID=YIDD_BAUCH|nr:membrane protein insertion efficiency factor YidD [Candidatus Baumannia cicadellinicola]Q1LTW0.1 RecName: Full=Putative membrane protein insertion efficiency factor [Baumannia cicadellinicola str. Hc (Homalodisca coagulata)]ABF14026.1 conserved hypothetical protein TIGR00278 [Baumannia cicadellinicola str. Hc (Homalodisca coagulata)]MBS0032659.1 membrane protein insertion efficiency factor YidD [Candidatus Baumannia cicadellinicola]MCJ7462415.1 membrane protein insertion efficiency factor Yi